MPTSRSETLSAPLLPWPPEWGTSPRPRRQLVLAFAFLIILAIGSIPFSISAANAGDYTKMTYGIVGILLCITVMIAALPGMWVRRKTLPHAMTAGQSAEGSPGLHIFYASSSRIIMVLWLIAGSVFLVLRAIMFANQASKPGYSASRHAISGAGILVIILVLAMLVFLGYYLFTQRNLRSYISLTEQGIVQRLGHTVKTLEWSEVGAISAGIVKNTFLIQIFPTPVARIAIDTGKSRIDRMQRGLMNSSIDVPTWVMKIDPALYLYLARYYLQHPDARHELTNDAVIERIRRGDLLD